jgi:FtsZ-binding cell division protein ZapB
MKKRPDMSPEKVDPSLSPADFLRLIERMPIKGAKLPPLESAPQKDQPEWWPAKWKKGWFAAHLKLVTGMVTEEMATKALEGLLGREDGLAEYAHWLTGRLAEPRDPWMGFAQWFATVGFFGRVQSRNAGAFRKIARGGEESPEESPAAERRVNERFRLLSNIAFSSGIGSELQVTDSYLRSRLTGSPEASAWVAKQQKPIPVFQTATRSAMTKQLLAQEFMEIPADVKSALDSYETEIAGSVDRDQANEITIERLQSEIDVAKGEAQQLRSAVEKAQKSVAAISREKDKIEDSGSDSSRILRDQFDGLRLSIADELERLLKVASEVARAVEDPKKKEILVGQIDQVLSLSTELRDPKSAAKRAGGL